MLDASLTVKSILQLTKWVMILMFYIHFQGCVIWNVQKDSDPKWVPQTDYMYGESLLQEEDQLWK